MKHTSSSLILSFFIAILLTNMTYAQDFPSGILKLSNGQVLDVDILKKTDTHIDVALQTGKVARYQKKDIEAIYGEDLSRDSQEYKRLLLKKLMELEPEVVEVVQETPKITFQSDTKDPKEAYDKAQAAYIENNNEQIIGYLTVAIDNKYKLEDSYYQRGNAYYNLADFQKAADDFSQLINISPESYIGYSNRGDCLRKINQPKAAIKDFNKAIELNPTDEFAFANRAMTYFNLGQTEKALNDLAKSIEIAPERASINYSNRAVIHLSLQQYQNAVNDLSMAIEGMPNVAGFYANRSAAYYYMGEYQKSYSDMLMAEKLGIPRNPSLELNLIKHLNEIYTQ